MHYKTYAHITVGLTNIEIWGTGEEDIDVYGVTVSPCIESLKLDDLEKIGDDDNKCCIYIDQELQKILNSINVIISEVLNGSQN